MGNGVARLQPPLRRRSRPAVASQRRGRCSHGAFKDAVGRALRSASPAWSSAGGPTPLRGRQSSTTSRPALPARDLTQILFYLYARAADWVTLVRKTAGPGCPAYDQVVAGRRHAARSGADGAGSSRRHGDRRRLRQEAASTRRRSHTGVGAHHRADPDPQARYHAASQRRQQCRTRSWRRCAPAPAGCRTATALAELPAVHRARPFSSMRRPRRPRQRRRHRDVRTGLIFLGSRGVEDGALPKSRRRAHCSTSPTDSIAISKSTADHLSQRRRR